MTTTAQQHAFDTLTIARAYVAAGLSVIPITPGEKTPAGKMLPTRFNETTGEYKPTWEPYQQRHPNEAEMIKWWGKREHSIAVVCGTISGGLVVIDLESVEAFAAWRDNAIALVGTQLVNTLPIVETGKGCHVYFRMPDPIGNRQLAKAGRTIIAETRGEGGYVLAPPSTHPSGATYRMGNGDLTQIAMIETWQAAALLDAARALAPTPEHPANTGATGEHQDIIGTYNAAHTIEQVLELHGYTQESAGRYIRPGGERSSVRVHAGRSTHYNSADPLYSEAAGGGHHSHSAFSAFCTLEHDGDVKAAVKAAAGLLGLSRDVDTPELLKAAGRAVGLSATPDGTHDTWPYFERDGALWMQRSDRDGTPKLPLPLTNFTAHITRERLLNDGENEEQTYSITAICNKRSRTIEMSRTDFESETALGRITAALGARARVNPATNAKYVLDAIKAFSHNVQEEHVYTHTGWVKDRYLFGNGYVDAEGWHAAPGAQLPQRLSQYQLTPPTTDQMPNAITTFGELLAIAPPTVIVPLLGGVLLSPISGTIGAPAPMIHLYGTTGSYKTSLCCAAMALWGNFTPAQPTDSWTSTANSVQRLGWHLKDAPMLLDDFKMQNIKPQAVTFLLQNYGDNMARGRLDANSEVKSAYPIRGTLISSGEDQPEGEASTLARILSVPIDRRGVHRGNLTSVQKHAHLLPLITIEYLRWLLTEPTATANNRQLHQATRASVLTQLEGTDNATNPGRVAANVATLYVAWETFGRFLVQRQLWNADQVNDWMIQCKQVLWNLAKTQVELTTQERYSALFLDTVKGLIASGKAMIVDLDAGSGQEVPPGLTLLGGYDAAGVYLICTVAYDEVCKHMRSAGRSAGFTARALSAMFAQEGLLLSTRPGKSVMQRRINGPQLV